MEAIKIDSLPDLLNIRTKYSEYVLLEYDKYLKELNLCGITLEEDPSKNLTLLNTKIAKIDAQKSRVGYIVNLAVHNENDLEMFVKEAHRIRDREWAKLLMSPLVKAFTSKELREAAANVQMNDIEEFVTDLDASYSRAKSFTRMAQNTLDMLESTNKNISRQVTIIQTQIETGEIQRKEFNRA